MKSIAVYCEPCAELSLALNEIEERIPCFSNWFFNDDDSIFLDIELSSLPVKFFTNC